MARWGFSRVLPGLKDVPGEAAAGAWGPGGSGGRGGISGIPQPAAARDNRGRQASRRRSAESRFFEAGRRGVRASLPVVGGGARVRHVPPLPLPPVTGAPPPGPAPPRPHERVPDPPVPAGARLPLPTPGVLHCPLFQRLKILKLYFGHVSHVTYRADDS